MDLMEDEEDFIVCIQCGYEYYIETSDSSDPEMFCSLACECMFEEEEGIID